MKRLFSILLVCVLTVTVFADTAGPRAPGTGADSNAVGTVTWSVPTNVLIEDAAVAQASSGSGNPITHYLKATNFGFTLPTGATVTGITVRVKRDFQDVDLGVNSFAVDSAVKIIKSDGSVSTTNRADASTHWPTSLAFASYGGTTDLWGETWTKDDINSANFGVAVAAALTNPDADTIRAKVDFIDVTVAYTTGPTAAQASAGFFMH